MENVFHRARCKGQSAFGNACTSGANRKNYYLALAPSVQTEKTAFGPLYRWCKSQKPLLGPCTDGVSRKKYFLVVAPSVQVFPKTFWPPYDSHRNSLLALFLRRTHVGVKAFSKRQNETRDRSRTSQNAFPPHETDQNFRKTPSRGGKWGKISEKRLPATGNGENSSKSHFLRRERGKILRKTPSCGGKASKSFGDRFRATGKGGESRKTPFRRGMTLWNLHKSNSHGPAIRRLVYRPR